MFLSKKSSRFGACTNGETVGSLIADNPEETKKTKEDEKDEKTEKNNERACMRELTRVPMSCGQAIDRMCGNGGENSVASTATKFLALRVDTGALFPLPCPQRRALC